MKKYITLLLVIILNIILIPNVHAYDTGREIFVRHINKDTGNIITELSNVTQEKIDASGNSTLINKTISTDAGFEYSEYYNIDINSTMSITKSLILKSNGKDYKYLGYNACTFYSIDEAISHADSQKNMYRAGLAELSMPYSNNVETSEFKIKQSNSNDVTIIDFFYTELSTTNITTQLYSKSDMWSGIDASDATDVTYVPAGGRVLPYFVTPKYIIRDLSYEKIIEDGHVGYKVNNFIVYRLENSYLKSSENIVKNGKVISGNLVGYSRDTVFSGISGVSQLDVKNETKNSITAELNSLLANSKTDKIPGNNYLDNLSPEKSGNTDFLDLGINVEDSKYNGLRSAKGNVVYTTYNVITGDTTGGFESQSKNEHYINVYTPVQLEMPEVEVNSPSTIDHSITNNSTIILSDESTFTIKVKCGDSNFSYYNNINEIARANFVSYYYFMFDFDVIHNGRNYPAGTAIRMRNTGAFYDGYTYFSGQVNPAVNLSLDPSEHKIVVFAQASNMPGNLVEFVAENERMIQISKEKDVFDRAYINDSGNNEVAFSDNIEDAVAYNSGVYPDGVTMYADGYYFAMQVLNVKTVSKIYDFKISDCNDLAYKSVFRNLNTDTDINTPTGNAYYSGIRRMFVFTSGNREHTTLLDRGDIKIPGTSSTKTLPFGPYKHTAASYINAPKLGYRISFDLKTTGYYTPGGGSTTARKIRVTPSYYYISKDGSTLIEDIDLYYKDSSQKYQKFEGSNYTIYFTPNDGYRYKSNSATAHTSSLSTKEEPLNIASSTGYFDLTDSMMTSDEANYIQCWYGEFKLPNSTIAVPKGQEPNNKLKDGYIAVKFDLVCMDYALNENISYSTPNNNNSQKTNTTQWDYEGYLGFSNPGQAVTENTSLRLQLEKGIWSIKDQATYEIVKGTVVLFDIDDCAADDIQ